MAREISYWQQKIDDATALKPSIANLLNNPSVVALYKTLRDIFSSAAFIFDSLFDRAKADLQAISDTSVSGTPLWWIDEMKRYQFGDNLQIFLKTGNFGKVAVYDYAVIDEAKKIIKFVAITKTLDQSAVLKVAKDDGNGLPEVLTNAELDGINFFVQRVQVAGLRVSVISLNTDLLSLQYDIYYNPLIMKSDGSLINDPAVFPFEEAVLNYNQNLRFDGSFESEKLEDKLQLANGYVSHEKIKTEGKSAGGTYAEFSRIYTAISGYARIDPAFPLSSTFNYIAANVI